MNLPIKCKNIVDWFSDLNPYAFGGSILKSETVNQSLDGNGKLQSLYCFAVSAKRYALFNMGSDGKPILRKASAHGLGHLRAPYTDTNPAIGIVRPVDKLSSIGVELWQHDLWIKIIEAAFSKKPNRVDLSYHSALQLPAIRRYAATSPAMKRWFIGHNERCSYAEQVKPFNFLTALSMRKNIVDEQLIDNSAKRCSKPADLKPIAPFTNDPSIAAATAFDRTSGELIPAEKFGTYAESLAQYHLHPENKFLNGDFLDTGMTLRRHVQATGICNIGKEANDLERQVKLGYDKSAQPAYGYCPDDITKLQCELERLCRVFSQHVISQHGGITAKRIADFIETKCNGSSANKDAPKMVELILVFTERELQKNAEKAELKKRIEREGLRETARQLNIDPSNLRRWAASKSGALDITLDL